ncbi:MAG: hypothetical protein AAGF12_19750 [Myxococcota bacterium]
MSDREGYLIGEIPSESDGSPVEDPTDLRRALGLIFHRLPPSDTPSDVGNEAFQLLRRVVSRGPIELRIAGDGVYRKGDRTLEFGAADRTLVRVFEHGIRVVRFLPGLSEPEVSAFLRIVQQPIRLDEHPHDDLTTLLAEQEFDCVQYEVVLGDGEGERLIREFVEAARSEAFDSADGGSLSERLARADVRVLRTEDLNDIQQTPPEIDEEFGVFGFVDPTLTALAEELSAELERPSFSLTRAVGAYADWTAKERPLLGALVGEAICQDAAERDTLRAGELTRWRSWVEAHRAELVCLDELTGPGLRELALGALTADLRLDRDAAIGVLKQTTGPAASAWLPRVAALPEGGLRARAIAALLDAEDPAETMLGTNEPPTPTLRDQVLLVIPTLDGEGASAVLASFRSAPFDRDSAAIFRTGLTHGSALARVQSMSWYAYYGGDHVVAVLRRALRSSVVEDRVAALYLIVRVRPQVGVGLLKAWFEGESFRKLPFDDKQLGALCLAKVGGQRIAETLRPWLQRKFIERPAMDEMHAAAAAAIAAIEDPEGIESLHRVVASRRGAKSLFRMEAERILRTLERQEKPFAPALELLDHRIDALGIRAALSMSLSESHNTVLPPGPDPELRGVTAPPEVDVSVAPRPQPLIGTDDEASPERPRAQSPIAIPQAPRIPRALEELGSLPSPLEQLEDIQEPPEFPATAQLPELPDSTEAIPAPNYGPTAFAKTELPPESREEPRPRSSTRPTTSRRPAPGRTDRVPNAARGRNPVSDRVAPDAVLERADLPSEKGPSEFPPNLGLPKSRHPPPREPSPSDITAVGLDAAITAVGAPAPDPSTDESAEDPPVREEESEGRALEDANTNLDSLLQGYLDEEE